LQFIHAVESPHRTGKTPWPVGGTSPDAPLDQVFGQAANFFDLTGTLMGNPGSFPVQSRGRNSVKIKSIVNIFFEIAST
jgi:hypothetical protein